MRLSAVSRHMFVVGGFFFANMVGCGHEAPAPGKSASAPGSAAAPGQEAKTEPAANAFARKTNGKSLPIAKGPQSKSASPDELLDQGNTAYEKRQYDKAIQLFGQLIKLRPKSPVAFYRRGLARAGRNFNFSAILDFNEAIRLRPDYREAFLARGGARRDSNRYDDAIKDYTEAIRLKSKDPEAYFQRGTLLGWIDEADKSIADYTEAIRLNPDYGEAYQNRGRIYEERDQFAEAVKNFVEVVRLSPNNANYLNALAWTLAVAPDPKVRDGKRAVDLAKKACQLSGSFDANHLDTLAAAYAEAEDFKNAVLWQQKAVKQSRDDNKADFRSRLKLYLAGKPYREIDDEHDTAIKESLAAIRKNPNDAEAYYRRGYAWWKKGETEKAFRSLNRVIELNPKHAKAHNYRANVLRDKNRTYTAIKDYDKAIQLDPKYAIAFYNRGMANRELKRTDKAIVDLTTALRLDPKDADAYYQRALAWQAKGEFGKAVEDYDESIRLKPSDLDARGDLAWLLATAKNANIRDGKRAIALATKNCELSEWEDDDRLDTLAAAYAEAGDFTNAIKWQKKSIELAPYSRRRNYRNRLKEYESGKPYRE